MRLGATTNMKLATAGWAGMMALVMVGSGCGESVDSEDIATSGIYGDFDATAEGNGKTDVEIALRVGGSTSNTTVELADSDALEVTAAGQNYTPNKWSPPFNDATHYRTTVDTEAGDTEIKISLTRADFDDAPSSTVTLPQPFSIQSPSANDEFSRENDDIAIQLSNADQDSELFVSVAGDCIDGYTEKVNGTGSAIISSGTLEKDEDDEDAKDTCDATLTVERRRSGNMDPAFEEGGRFRAKQVRSVDIRTKP